MGKTIGISDLVINDFKIKIKLGSSDSSYIFIVDKIVHSPESKIGL